MKLITSKTFYRYALLKVDVDMRYVYVVQNNACIAYVCN